MTTADVEEAEETTAAVDTADEVGMTTTVAEEEDTEAVGTAAATKSVAHSVCVDNGKLFGDFDSCWEILIK